MKSGKAAGLVRHKLHHLGATCLVVYIHILAGFREAVTFLGMDEAAPLSSLDSYVYDFIKKNSKVKSTFCVHGS